MTKTVKDLSLGFIDTLNKNVKTCENLNAILANTISPGSFLEKFPDFKSDITTLDSNISRAKNNLQFLISSYKESLEQSKAIISGYISRIQDRVDQPVQLNSNVTFYDEENQMSKSCYRGFDEEPMNYSILAIMNRIVSDEEHNLSCFEKVLEQTSSIYQWYVFAQHTMLTIRSRIEDNDFIQLFTSDYLDAMAEKEITRMQRHFNDVIRCCTNARNMITNIFQMFVAMERDHAIYEKAVDRFEQTALESYFATGAVTSGVF